MVIQATTPTLEKLEIKVVDRALYKYGIFIVEVISNNVKRHTNKIRNLKPKWLLLQSEVSKFGWEGEAFADIEKRLSHGSEFPCVFSKNAFKKNLILYYFVDDTRSVEIANLAEALREYVNISRDWDSTLDTSYPLIVSFSDSAITANTVEKYQAFGWRILQQLHELDNVDWPTDVATEATKNNWSMCFSGMPIFCNMSNPCHELRLSRNLGHHFKIIINPRERFDFFAGETVAGKKIRKNVRERIERYDDIPHASQLASYHAGGLEWLQYGLPDHNGETNSSCPFTFNNKVTK